MKVTLSEHRLGLEYWPKGRYLPAYVVKYIHCSIPLGHRHDLEVQGGWVYWGKESWGLQHLKDTWVLAVDAGCVLAHKALQSQAFKYTAPNWGAPRGSSPSLHEGGRRNCELDSLGGFTDSGWNWHRMCCMGHSKEPRLVSGPRNGQLLWLTMDKESYHSILGRDTRQWETRQNLWP